MNLDTYKLLDGQGAFSELHSTLTSVCLSAGRAFGKKQNKTKNQHLVAYFSITSYFISYEHIVLYLLCPSGNLHLHSRKCPDLLGLKESCAETAMQVIAFPHSQAMAESATTPALTHPGNGGCCGGC